jgi:hypothetical protein
MINPSLSAKRGVSLNEIMIAIVILAMALMPSLNMLFTFKSYTLHTEDVMLALHLANEKLEEYKHLDFHELARFDGNVVNGPVSGQDNPLGFSYSQHQFKKYKRKVQIHTNYGGDKNKVMITCHVWWHENLFDFNDRRFVKISALKTNEDIF